MSEVRKFRAQMIEIIGFSLMTPAARLFLGIPGIQFNNIRIIHFVYCIGALLLFYFGIICLARAQEIIEGK